ncbi:hypothetical protein PT974_00790 [Cladobotryum mycophilum]|uniref:Amidohydrolase-related domain-containing protein n=1 Tax=Cladobotryum mycophilum TaxID=491253 RepID=A0ABR0T1V2_9HYPO
MRIPIHQPPPPSPVTTSQPPTNGGGGDEDDEPVTIIWAQLLIPGRGQPINNGIVALKGDKIDWVGSFLNRPSKYSHITPTYVNVLMPGLWDCHTHFFGMEIEQFVGGGTTFLPGANALAGAITTHDLERTLMAGYTSVRELAGYAGDLWPGVKSGMLVGPNIYSAIAALSMTGGHVDVQVEPLPSVIRAMNYTGLPIGVCDGVDGCTQMVRQMVRRGARCIKVCSSGGVLSLNDDPEDRQFSDEELKAMVDEAGRTRRAVAAHAIGKAGIMAALRAGVKSIEHGMYLDEEAADLMLEKDAIFVEKVTKLVEQSKTSYKLAIKKGIKIALGTDMGSSDVKSSLNHGNNAHEIVYAVELGMTPLQAIECATANAPEVLGGMAPQSGQLRAGYDADLIAIRSNPLEDISVLTKPSNVTHVWKGGKLFKSPPGLPV